MARSLVKHRLLGVTSAVCGRESLGLALRIRISKKFPGDGDASSSGTVN